MLSESRQGAKRRLTSFAGLGENERFALQCQAASSGQFAALVGGHASFTMSDDTLAACVALANRLTLGIHIHVAEDPVDQQITLEQTGRGLIERFQHFRLLDLPQTILAHGTHLSDDDFTILEVQF